MYDTANREDGTARFYQIPETTIIAKTGTTQLAAVGGGGYSTGKTIVSLMAAMPAEDPKVLVYYAFQADYDKNAHVKSDAIKSVLRKVAMTYNFAGQQDVSEPSAPSAEIVPIHESTMPSLINHTLTLSLIHIYMCIRDSSQSAHAVRLAEQESGQCRRVHRRSAVRIPVYRFSV